MPNLKCLHIVVKAKIANIGFKNKNLKQINFDNLKKCIIEFVIFEPSSSTMES